jgi:hypothetical protein
MNWGLPDWRDASAYPEPDAITRRQWWWEFTRRHPDLRALWMEFSPRWAVYVEENKAHFEQMATLTGIALDSYLECKLDAVPTGDPRRLERQFKLRGVVLNPAKSFSDDFLRHYWSNDGVAGCTSERLITTQSQIGSQSPSIYQSRWMSSSGRQNGCLKST